MADAPEVKRWTLSDTIIVSVMPAIAYGVAYFFEAGYLSHFGIPEFLVSVSFERFFYALSVIVTLYIVIINFLDPIFEFFPEKLKKINPSHYLFLLLLLIVILGGSFGIIIKGFNWYYLTLLLVGVVGFFFVFIYPAIGKSTFSEYIQELDRIDEADRERRRKSLTSKLTNKDWGGAYIAALFILLVCPPTFKLLGSYIAHKENSFLVTKVDNVELALIRKYGEDSILVDFQRKWKTLYSCDPVFGKKIIIKKISDQSIIFDQVKLLRQER
ncbi:MAG: hypothetical protein J0L77_06175 [Alphaproteobacteria bacterium]|nr:hypothetical protein [Alphaproteobacteria bacterium]